MGHNASSQLNFVSQLLNDESTSQTLISEEIQDMSYETFLKLLGELNVLSKKCLDSSGKQLVFAVKRGTDSTVFWKATVQIACVKVDAEAENQKVDSYRLLTLSEFLRVFKTLKCQYLAVQQCKSLNPNREPILSTSTFFNHLDNVTSDSLGGVERSECCICLERKIEVILPCAHSYCTPCIEQWNEVDESCPICRERLESTEDAWVLSEVPKAEEISKEIQSNLMNLADVHVNSCTSS
ncbi:hypothetical protein PPYR_07607 [Photinus pyralis]|uniref:RING finger protein 141 n=1 Tax=Photinus pyralis TaxID=7054 RepID=A0A1Y1LDU7_PHOPY|nr:RING finger protein 141-like [Photinus pyralis]KAB0799727.1 hypothetical protein PPYR_07607 [Photinus pyralis]